jgi:hypothetical protein
MALNSERYNDVPFMLSDTLEPIMMNGIMMGVVMLNVMAPSQVISNLTGGKAMIKLSCFNIWKICF